MLDGLRELGIRDERLLSAMRSVPRHVFVPEAFRARAYHNDTLPIGHRQTMSQPLTVALMLQALDLRGEERVLEIGAGTGYQTALLASLGRAVFSIERVAELARKAQVSVRSLGFNNVTIKHFDGTYGWPEYSPYHAIVVCAAAPELPRPLADQLAPGGRLVLPLARPGGEEICLASKRADSSIDLRPIVSCRFVPLIGKFGF